MTDLFKREVDQILTLSRELFECSQVDAAYYLLKAAAVIPGHPEELTDAILDEARYQLSQREGHQWEGAIDITVRDYIQLMHTTKQDSELVARMLRYFDEHGSLDGFFEQEGT